jgi:cell pole-organizing protein PopZ
MTSAANPQHEPTMEEILASIRKIISEDQPEPAKPAPQPVPLRAVQAMSAKADADVLELTEEVRDEEPEPAPEPEPEPEPEAAPEPPLETASQPAIENDVVFETVEPEPNPEPAAQADADDLISESTRSAMGRSFAKLDPEPMKPASLSAGTLDGLFAQAVQEAFAPALQEWVDGHKAEIMDGLKPMIRAWMDQNLPRLIEAAVTKEVSRALAERPRGR